jgi:hypothetical protein
MAFLMQNRLSVLYNSDEGFKDETFLQRKPQAAPDDQNRRPGLSDRRAAAEAARPLAV